MLSNSWKIFREIIIRNLSILFPWKKCKFTASITRVVVNRTFVIMIRYAFNRSKERIGGSFNDLCRGSEEVESIIFYSASILLALYFLSSFSYLSDKRSAVIPLLILDSGRPRVNYVYGSTMDLNAGPSGFSFFFLRVQHIS